MKPWSKFVSRLPVVLCALALAGAAQAQFDPGKVKPEPPGVAAHFAEPAVRYATPGLREGREDFTSHAEMLAFVESLAKAAPRLLHVEVLGQSQEGRAMPLLVLSAKSGVNPKLPTVLVLGQQHGNEPAGGEAALVLAQQLSGPRASLLEHVNVLIVPRANPDGAERFTRVAANGIDINRDHLLLRTPEARLIAGVAARYRPQVVLDLHEFTVGDRWIAKFGAYERYDALLQAATVGNLNPRLGEFSEHAFVDPMRAALAADGQHVFWYHTSSTSGGDKRVAMGGVQPDTGRNVNGLRQAVSVLIETRGIGIGRAHYARRVRAQVLAAMTAIETAARRGGELLAVTREADREATASACRGELVVQAQQTPGRQAMEFLDAATGELRNIEVDWRSAMPLKTVLTRPRPCGYLLAASEAKAVEHLRMLGVRVQTVRAPEPGSWPTERYLVDDSEDGQRQDVRGAIDDGQAVRLYKLHAEAGNAGVASGSYYVSLAQPLSALISAALEPDSQNSYAANRLLEFDGLRLLRVMRPLPAAMLGE